MANMLRGVALMNSISTDRPGSNIEYEALRDLFAVMQVTVYDWNDQVAGELANRHQKWRDIFANCDYVMVYHGSHGTSDGYVEIGPGPPVNAVRHYLNRLYLFEELNGKLKWLINQSCRGGSSYKIVSPCGGPVYYKNYYLISYSTSEGSLSERTAYVQELCRRLRDRFQTTGLLAILGDIQNVSQTNYQQNPCFDRNFPGDFHFTSGFRC